MNLRPLNEREFALFQDLIAREAGIHLPKGKMALLSARLSRHIRELGLPDFEAYFKFVTEGGAAEMAQLLDRICTNETRFFREPKQFEFLEKHYFQRQHNVMSKRLRIWSAACSTGEEPYSIAMSVAAHLPDHHAEILASDLSERALTAAAAGIWPIKQSEEIPPHYLKAYMLRGIGGERGKMRAGDQLRSMISFRRINLHSDRYAIDGQFDLIFCRNVLIYFGAETKAAVISRLLQRLAPGGLLLLGQAESLAAWTHAVRAVGPTIYTHHG
jgi:chemotaxis protein methyltransferase CheR